MKIKKIVAVLFLAIALSSTAFAQTCVIKRGDTLYGICKKYGCDINEIKQFNPHLKNSPTIKPGQKLTVPPTNVSKLESQVATLVNQERAKKGLMMLSANSMLSKVARYKSTDMATKNYFSHTSPTYGSPFKMMENFGVKFSAAGENIAYGQPTAQAVMNAWMNSPGHRSNILNPTYNRIGVGAAKNKNGVIYWTQEFIKAM